MRYHTRQKIKLGLTLAVARFIFRVLPNFVCKKLFFRDRVSWGVISVNGSRENSFYQYSRFGKFKHIRFWLNWDDIGWYSKTDPFDSLGMLIESADNICNHRINIFGAGKQSYGQKIDWSCDPFSGSRFPSNMFSSRPADCIDRRFLTELNLHRHFPVLALAWLTSGKQYYAGELVSQLLDWIRKNPPVRDTFVSDGLELSARIVCWTYCLILIREYPIAEDDYIEILIQIDSYGKLIENQYGEIEVKNNHQIAEAFGLFFIGVMYPELIDADKWRKKGLALLSDNIEAQFYADGVHAEQSISYHMFVLECCLLTILLSRANHIALPNNFYKVVEKASDFISCLRKPNGKLPLLGDMAFRFFCPTGDPTYDPDTLLMISEGLNDRKKSLGMYNPRLEEVFWLMGRKRLEKIQAKQVPPNVIGTKVFPDSGHVVVHSDYINRSQYLYFKCGPQGLGCTAGHGHDDVLNIEYSALGEEFLVDPGTYTYMGIHPLRRYFMGARAHNILLVDHKGAAVPDDGPFGWKKTVDGVLEEVASSKDITWITGQHYGYTDSCKEIVVGRALLIVRGRYTLVIDLVKGIGIHEVENLLHFHPDIEVNCHENSVEARGQKARLWISMLSSAQTSLSLHRGTDEKQPGWYSEQYGHLRPSYVLRAASRTKLPFWRIIVLFPVEAKNTSIPMKFSIADKSQGDSMGEATVSVNLTNNVDGETSLFVFNWNKSTTSLEGAGIQGFSMYKTCKSGAKQIVTTSDKMISNSGPLPKSQSDIEVLEFLYQKPGKIRHV